MSLINQMLQDLESRRTKPAPSNGAALNDLIWPGGSAAAARTSSLVEQISRSPVLRLVALVGVSLLTAIILWAVWRGLAPRLAPSATQPVAEVAPPVSPPTITAPESTPTIENAPTATDTVGPTPPIPIPADTAAAAATVAPTAQQPASNTSAAAITQIQGLRLSVLPDHTRVVLDASAPLTHRLSVHSERVVLDLERATLTQPLPKLDLRKSLLSQIQAESEGEQGLRLTLTLRSAAQAKTLVLGPEQNYGHRLVIDLYPEGVKDSSGLMVLGSAGSELAAAPAHSAVQAAAARGLKKQRALSVAEQAEQAYQDGIQLLQHGKPETAEPLLRRALVLDARHLKAREALADTLLKQGRTTDAEAVLTVGIRLQPDYLLFTKLYARVLVEQGDISAALAVLEDKATGTAQDAEYQAFLAALYQRMERHHDAISAYRKALASQPQQGVWWMGLGISLEAAKQQAEALEAYRRAQAAGNLTPAVLGFIKGRISSLKGEISG